MMLDHLIAVFVHGFAFTRSFTHPYQAEQLQPGVWVLRDAPRVRGDYRNEEYITTSISGATELDALARQHARGRFKISVIRDAAESDAGIRAAFRTLGYRLLGTELFMQHRLAALTSIPERYPVIRVTSKAEAQLLAQAARSRQILAEHLVDPAPMRQYMVLDDGTPVGWVGSVVVGDCTWCTNLFVAPSHRRRGIARALLTRMLADDKAAGARANILTSSHTGAKLYPTVGYETIGELLLFAPPRHMVL